MDTSEWTLDGTPWEDKADVAISSRKSSQQMSSQLYTFLGRCERAKTKDELPSRMKFAKTESAQSFSALLIG
ncbi:hypothetical protein AJ80_08322 [Polytolypa hystricis UAMH7299]|uniref:Uncharacterized protein n=1 Tax=Polytolypa hystricis (strain UAMH7299) TaxID=1447883 RepID=A0A2B7X9S4_POLH7|nr:hypothetical protein AJ80_08322 [Polytolypa hystricis UAMH7299]